jgi:anthranilate synthase component I
VFAEDDFFMDQFRIEGLKMGGKLMESEKMKFTIETVEGDIHTPISIFRKIQEKKKFLLESSAAHQDQGRYSYIGFRPYLEVSANGNEYQVSGSSTNPEVKQGNVMEQLAFELMIEIEAPPLPIPFFGGAVGYFGYDMIRQYENIGPVPEDVLNMPDAHFLFFRDLFVYDHLLQKIHLVTSGKDPQPIIKEMKETLNRPNEADGDIQTGELSFQSNMSKEKFVELVNEAKKAIVAGEVFQIVLSQRFQSPFKGDPFQLYRRLRLSNPSPYLFYIDFDDYTVLGSSPESLLSVKNQVVTGNPIAGTRPRGRTPEEDESLAKDLLADEKELAEHKMLVDLGRNDLGRVCEIGSVEISSYMKIEKYKHVMHITSKLTGQLKQELTSLDALAACMPAGTVSGAPKIRAMEWINKLENNKRGVYAGSVGYIGFGGNLDMGLAIRTMVVKDQYAYVQAGAGIVYDSVPETEFEETQNKAKALLEVQQYDPVNR